MHGCSSDVDFNHIRTHRKLDIHIPDHDISTPSEVNVDSPSIVTASRPSTSRSSHKAQLRPVVVFIYGGSWAFGSRRTYTLLGARLRQLGYIAVIPDYTVFPRGRSKEMEEDVRIAVQWTFENCRQYGGDPNRIYLMGHSAGAHLAALTVLKDCVRQTFVPESDNMPQIESSPVLMEIVKELTIESNSKNRLHEALPRLQGLMLCSGVYDISEHLEHEVMRGLEHISAMSRVMGGSALNFGKNSPTVIVQELLKLLGSANAFQTSGNERHVLDGTRQLIRAILPPKILVIHGEDDRTPNEYYNGVKGGSTTKDLSWDGSSTPSCRHYAKFKEAESLYAITYG
ncbi:hypothetical protein BGW38_000850 [Lunasporangiospora selenospora]|uniref:BD-FAE-like domain-containing protein n=1 Tax=Lunasporangiospora selenospora TaxID=979761 RepID=A0A9P6G1Q5_9FUNG|nr:hypothetical protein BGW38_000850 [Lunasporangiospora selenospora]